MRELHLFAGAGGGILAGQLLGHRCVCAVEREPYAQAVLVARQNDGTFPPFPIWDDVRTFDGRPWRGIVDVVAGGFPCQDISVAGDGQGIEGERSGLWTEMVRIVREVRPRIVFVENSPMLTSRGLGRVLGDLAAMGFDAEWGVVSAADVGAPHLRERIWIVAHLPNAVRGGHGIVLQSVSQSECGKAAHAGRDGETRSLAYAYGEFGGQGRPSDASQGERGGNADRGAVSSHISDSERPGLEGGTREGMHGARWSAEQPASGSQNFGRWPVEPGMGRVVNGLAHRAHRIRALGNGQVSRVAATAFTLLSNQ